MEQFVEQLNNTLASVLDGFKTCKAKTLYGIAEPVLTRDTENEITLPAIVDELGECYDVFGHVDENDIVLYHKLNSISYSGSEASYGSRTTYRKEADMSLVVYGRRTMGRDAVEKALCAKLSGTKGVSLNNTEFGAVQILATEYAGLPYFLNPDYFLFRINYRVTSTLAEGCIK